MASEGKRSIGLFEVAYIVLLALLVFFAMFQMGRPRVGVLDVGEVARASGMRDKITADDQAWRADAEAQAQKLRREFEALTRGLQEDAKEAKTEEAGAAIRKQIADASQDFIKQTSSLRGKVMGHRRDVLATFRRRLQPFINEVARGKRLWVVLDRNAGLLYIARTVDITGDVAGKAKSFFAGDMSLVESEDETMSGQTGSVMPDVDSTTASNSPVPLPELPAQDTKAPGM